MKKLIFYLFLIPYYLFGQDTIVEDNRTPLLIIKYSLLSLIDIYHPSIQFAAEYPISSHWSLQHEAGFIKYLFRIIHLDRTKKMGIC